MDQVKASHALSFVVRSNPKLEPQQMLDAMGRQQHVNPQVVASMPRGEAREVRIVFFAIEDYVTEDRLQEHYVARKLRPATPYELAAHNKANPAFADKYRNATHWQGEDLVATKCVRGDRQTIVPDRVWSFIFFEKDDNGVRYVAVNLKRHGWNPGWYFAGVEIENG